MNKRRMIQWKPCGLCFVKSALKIILCVSDKLRRRALVRSPNLRDGKFLSSSPRASTEVNRKLAQRLSAKAESKLGVWFVSKSRGNRPTEALAITLTP